MAQDEQDRVGGRLLIQYRAPDLAKFGGLAVPEIQPRRDIISEGRMGDPYSRRGYPWRGNGLALERWKRKNRCRTENMRMAWSTARPCACELFSQFRRLEDCDLGSPLRSDL